MRVLFVPSLNVSGGKESAARTRHLARPPGCAAALPDRKQTTVELNYELVENYLAK